PSIGGGTKLIRTLLAGEGEGVCSDVGEGTIECSGEIEGEGASTGIGEGVGVGDSCAIVTEDNIAIAKTRLTLVFMSSATRDVSSSLNAGSPSPSNIERFVSLASRSLSLWPSRPSCSFPAARFSTSLGMTEAKHNNIAS